jgi:molybdopterin converting factor subunit 1
MASVRVLYFAKSREVAGVPEEAVQLEQGSTSCANLVDELQRRHPGLSSVLPSCVLAVNQEYVQLRDQLQLETGDEVAVIPPLSGG